MNNNKVYYSFSLIIIGYNVSSTLLRCLKSVINLEYPNYEVIYVDDGSTDNSLEITKIYSDKIKIISKKNGGIVSARKEGLKVSKNEFVLFIDGDDFVDKEILNVFNETLINSNNPDIILASFFSEDKHTNFSSVEIISKKKEFRNDEYLKSILLDELPHYMFSKCFKRDFLINSGYLNLENISMAEDLLTNVVLGLNEPFVVFTNTPVYYYCLNDTNMSRRENNRIFDQIETLKIMESHFKKIGLDSIYKDLIEFQWISYVWGYTFKPDFSFKFKKKFIKKLRPYIKYYYRNKVYKEWHVSFVKKPMFFCMIYLPFFRFFSFIVILLRYKIKKYVY